MEILLGKLFNKKLFKLNQTIDNFVGDNRHLQISTKCSIIECFKRIEKCDPTGLMCQCCEILTCVPNIPAEELLVNGRSRSYLSQEDKNIIHLCNKKAIFNWNHRWY